MINLVTAPFHDWKKCLREGFRDRDAHFIEHLLEHRAVEKVLVINRPMTYPEMLARRTSWKTPGDILLQQRNFQLVQVHNKGYVLDYLSGRSLQHILLQRKWYIYAFAMEDFVNSVLKACGALGMEEISCFSNHVLAAGLFRQIASGACVFDADDDWLRFPKLKGIQDDLRTAYRVYAKVASIWTTNSEQNQKNFAREFGVKDIIVIRNGVDEERFQTEYPIPEDLKMISRPIIGFGGRINHLVDAELLNRVVQQNRDKSFVIVGEILDGRVFRAIVNHPNLFYLGDKHYDEYPAYVTNFDVCIMPYVIGGRAHGGDAIKLYEYIAAGKPVVSTNGNGAENLREYVRIANGSQEFSEAINRSLSEPGQQKEILLEFTWRHKTELLISLMRKSRLQKRNAPFTSRENHPKPQA
jgi:teichuronic acid biosynthesis glycosyltransferase TuaH